VARALEQEGLGPTTAQAVLADLQPEGRDEPSDLVYGVDLQGLRERLPQDNDTVLAKALERHGLQSATAAAVVRELRESERLGHGERRARLRRLGVQGMVVGSVFTGLFIWTATRGDHDGRVDIVTAGVTTLLALYSFALFHRNRPPSP
jgi:hypothetical protein